MSVNVAVGVLEGVTVAVAVRVNVLEAVTVNVGVRVGVKVAVGVLDDVTVKVGVLEGVIEEVGVFEGVGVNVTIAHNGAESDNPAGFIVLTDSSYSLTYFTCGICFSEARNGSKRLYELPSVEQLPDR